MSKVTNRITIKRPIGDVFAVLTDVENAGTWFPGDVEEHWTSPPPHGVGSTRHAVVVMWGRRTENDAVTTEYRPPYRAAMRGTSPNAPFEATLDFRETPRGRPSRSCRTCRCAARSASSARSWPPCMGGCGRAGWPGSRR